MKNNKTVMFGYPALIGCLIGSLLVLFLAISIMYSWDTEGGGLLVGLVIYVLGFPTTFLSSVSMQLFDYLGYYDYVVIGASFVINWIVIGWAMDVHRHRRRRASLDISSER
jgi:hypothetical protein